MSTELAPCGTYNALRRHRKRGDTCATCDAAHKARQPELAPCGTHAARKRHKKRGETCGPCTPKPATIPCGTPNAYRRHKRRGETACEPCHTAFLAWDTENRRAKGIKPSTTAPIEDLIEDIIFLLNAGEGEHAILKATGYLGRENSLQTRLQRNGRGDLYNRIINHWELAA